ncbi:tetratricopeptide repeat protein [Maribacter sp. CXY002]|uniref:tetratricopeptide repeat protein n=1 Tax=Maribacter luteocoastalis TaxID=3407671 RepID=UPI003B673EDD
MIKENILGFIFFLGLFTIPKGSYAQEENQIEVEESAEVFLEEYTDDFQEKFFEALKQKGIQNYDRAINALLSCIELTTEKDVISHELSKTYLLDKQYIAAEQHALDAIKGNPDNYWYAYTLVTALEVQNKSLEHVKSDLPWNNEELKSNLAKAYFVQGNFREAKTILKDVKKNNPLRYLESKVKDSLAKKDPKNKPVVNNKIVVQQGENNVLDNYIKSIEDLLNSSKSLELILASEEAMDNYPSQPFFYYANAVGLKRNNKNPEAIEALETALDYVLSDVVLENKIYKELAEVYTLLNNPEKANMYLSKVKPGF